MNIENLTVKVTVRHKWLMYVAAYFKFFTDKVFAKLINWSMEIG